MSGASTVDAAGSARQTASGLLARAAEQFPDVQPPSLDLPHLSPEDKRLAVAIYRIAIQRWLTLDAVLNRYLPKGLAQLEPAMQGVLRAASVQLLFMQRLPAYAVVDQSVALARQLVRPKAAGMANAVLRNVAKLPDRFEADEPWMPGESRLPVDGGTLYLNQQVLPDVARATDHLAAATSHPRRLVRRWIEQYGEPAATGLCLHGLTHPPTIVAVEPGFDATAHADLCQPHQRDGFVLWQSGHDELVLFLSQQPTRRVQDPASSLAVASTASLRPESVLDLCAGRGTKTRQLAVIHPQADILATDTDAERLADLRSSTAAFDRVRAVAIDTIEPQRFDLILLDVPCSNTGVLSRRPEARYRFAERQLASLIAMQRQIISRGLGVLKPGGYLLYSTCSIDPDENRSQIQWLIEQSRGQVVHEHLERPAGRGNTFHDGSYHALVQVSG